MAAPIPLSAGQSQVHPAISQHSRTASQYLSSDVEELTDEQLVKSVNRLKHQVKVLTMENELLERVIMRVEPALMNGVQTALEYAFKIGSAASFDKSASRTMATPSSFWSAGTATVIFGSGPRINILERSELIVTETGILIRKSERAREMAKKQQCLLNAQLEEIALRDRDIDKALENFNQAVIIDGWNKISQRIPAEAWIRYMSGWIKLCDKEMGKLRLRNTTYNSQYHKYNSQIKIKQELNDMLRPVDFEKLEIENKDLSNTINKKLSQLAGLKKMVGDANLALTMHKNALMEQNNYLSKVKKNIANKKQLTVKLRGEKGKIAEQADSIAQQLVEVKKERMSFEVPDVMDYVKVKAEMFDLKRCVKRLQHQIYLQKIEMRAPYHRPTSVAYL